MTFDAAVERDTTTVPPQRDGEDKNALGEVGSGAAPGPASGATSESSNEGSSQGKKRNEGGKTNSIAQLSPEEKKRIRAERNRESAEKSRLRNTKRETVLEEELHIKRTANLEMKQCIDNKYAEFRAVANKIEQCITREEAIEKYPQLYDTLNTMTKAMEKCVWTYRDPTKPNTPAGNEEHA